MKAADGVTDLHGVMYKPYDFDPGRKYPVIDYIYNGPFTKWVPRTFLDGRGLSAQAQAQLVADSGRVGPVGALSAALAQQLADLLQSRRGLRLDGLA